jgi:protein-tyrosine phosphatase
MIDLHSHVLPGIDDGAADVSDALELAAAAASGGVRVLAATPHVCADHPGVIPGELAGRCRELNAQLAEAGVALEICQGGELDLDWATAASDEDLRLVSYRGAGSDLLVETPYVPLPDDFEERVLALAGRGFRLLLAHPERSEALQLDPARVARLVSEGVLVQLTARSLVRSAVPRAVQEAAVTLVTEGLVHVLASDAHAAIGHAPPDLARGVAVASALGGPRAHWMASEAPAAILAGEPLPQVPDLEPSA